MKIARLGHGGVISADAYPQRGLFITRWPVDVAFEDGAFLRVPLGFLFDGASIPPRARSLIESLTTAGSVAFVIHDYAYADGARYIAPDGKRIPISRQRADWIALALCNWLDLSCEDSLEIYAGLRLGGAANFRRLPVLRTLDGIEAVLRV